MDDRIILVDDDPDYLDILTTRLTAAGFRNLRAEPAPHATI
jgi:DNA-binding response OmpR family regulator